MADFFREIDKKVMQVICTDFSNGNEIPVKKKTAPTKSTSNNYSQKNVNPRLEALLKNKLIRNMRSIKSAAKK
ncbi:hypothetical protein QU600_001421 [Orientia tsutsugamushi]|uniref:hypothetical protein n=1 Tax=Orientia tsutsugamushi TaxID=784 RepID=UPI00315DBBF1